MKKPDIMKRLTLKNVDVLQYRKTAAETVQNIELIDESGVAKKGLKSVGVARQYCGSVGNVDNTMPNTYSIGGIQGMR